MPRRLIVVLLLLASCGDAERPAAPSAIVPSFDAYADTLFGDLSATPMVDSVDIAIGLFGDLNVMAGERIVMGRYRYRIDSTSTGPVGHITFMARREDAGMSVPIILTFSRSENSWILEEADYVSERAAPTMVELLRVRLDPWVRSVAGRVVP